VTDDVMTQSRVKQKTELVRQLILNMKCTSNNNTVVTKLHAKVMSVF